MTPLFRFLMAMVAPMAIPRLPIEPRFDEPEEYVFRTSGDERPRHHAFQKIALDPGPKPPVYWNCRCALSVPRIRPYRRPKSERYERRRKHWIKVKARRK